MKPSAILQVNLSLLKKNCKTLQSLSPHPFFCPMLKAEAYGHGALPVAKTLFKAGVQQVGVINTQEAEPIKQSLKNLDILIFGPLLSLKDLTWIVKQKLVIVCSNWEDLKNISKLKQKVRIHLKFDTGFTRLGFYLKEASKLYDFLKQNPHIKLEGLGTQLVLGEELGDSKSFSFNQLLDFLKLKAYFPKVPFHALNTSAMLACFSHSSTKGVYDSTKGVYDSKKGTRFYPDLSDSRKQCKPLRDFGLRPGIGLYGLKPEILIQNKKAQKKDLSLAPVSCLKSFIVGLHKIPKGRAVSYGGLWRAKKTSQVATVSLGYGDGFLRSSLAGRSVLFRGKKQPVIGTLCMDFFMIDVTNCKAPIKLGEEVVIFGRQGSAYLSPKEQAAFSGTIPYELLSRLGTRVKRIYTTK